MKYKHTNSHEAIAGSSQLQIIIISEKYSMKNTLSDKLKQ